MKIPSHLLAFVSAAMAAAAVSCVTDGPGLPRHLDPASDQVAESPQPLARSLAADALAEYWSARAELERAIGGLLDRPLAMSQEQK